MAFAVFTDFDFVQNLWNYKVSGKCFFSHFQQNVSKQLLLNLNVVEIRKNVIGGTK